MRKFQLLLLLTILILSCQSNSDFNESNKFYKGIEDGKELYVTFIDDTIVAINSDSLKSCGWNIMTFESSINSLYKTNELKTDTMWVKQVDKKIILSASGKDMLLEQYEVKENEIKEIKKDIEITRNLISNGIGFECHYTFKEINYFYETAVQEVKKNLKNSNTAKFKEAFIHKYRGFNKNEEYVTSTTTLVSLEVEAKNGFGNFVEDDYNLFFFPNDKNGYDIEFSESSVLDYKMKERLKFD